jgi:hypothetical protein
MAIQIMPHGSFRNNIALIIKLISTTKQTFDDAKQISNILLVCFFKPIAVYILLIAMSTSAI